MTMPSRPVRDLMDRTLFNLDFVKRQARENGPYEFTQLLNSCLAVICHPWEKIRDEVENWDWIQAKACGWEPLPLARPSDKTPSSFYDELRQLRNGLAHGNLELYSGSNGQIHGVHIWNELKGTRTWGTMLTAKELEQVLRCFHKIATQEIK